MRRNSEYAWTAAAVNILGEKDSIEAFSGSQDLRTGDEPAITEIRE
jgi:hypothetical protein